jgi:uncharacterized protein (UPF0276 family)
MLFAVNYSAAAERLLDEGRIAFDRFKCPAWPDLVARVSERHRVHVHFPLLAGAGQGDVLDGETGGPPDWARIERLLAATGAAFVNVHLTPGPVHYPGLDPRATDATAVALVGENLVRDVEALVRRFGAERVVAENDPDHDGSMLAALLPEVISAVIAQAGCGLLLDLAHVRITAASLGVDPRAYTAALPVHRLREIHLSGAQRLEGVWVERLNASGEQGQRLVARHQGRLMDHLPMTGEDWALTEWAFEQMRAGAWRRPDLATFEYGGVGPDWEAVTLEDALAEQAPRLRWLVATVTLSGSAP